MALNFNAITIINNGFNEFLDPLSFFTNFFLLISLCFKIKFTDYYHTLFLNLNNLELKIFQLLV